MNGDLRDAGGAGGGEENSEPSVRLGRMHGLGHGCERQVLVKLGRGVQGSNVCRAIGTASPLQDDFAIGQRACHERRAHSRGAIGAEHDPGATGITQGIGGAHAQRLDLPRIGPDIILDDRGRNLRKIETLAH
jgi:hypothetical protein